MLTRKALWIPAAASGLLLVVLAVTGWSGGADTASPASASVVPSTRPSQVSLAPPAVAEISVKTTTTTSLPPTTTTTTSVAKPPPQQVRPPVQPTTVSETPDRGLFVVEGAPCKPEGAIGVSPRGEPLVCRKNDSTNRLRWTKA
ncbi:hypothetical protein [Lentzea sp. NBRC 105346]|uniref:hypothetical protein n=1 Tax=Lentzea sp. NBRC 105346 TaxID=3032205 RepID=UPI0025568D5A|nr:hypothetical protein [Lentzea sp. NBRC 105346]